MQLHTIIRMQRYMLILIRANNYPTKIDDVTIDNNFLYKLKNIFRKYPYLNVTSCLMITNKTSQRSLQNRTKFIAQTLCCLMKFILVVPGNTAYK